MEGLVQVLRQLDIPQYIDVIIREGFSTFSDLCDITETDLERMGVKLGHRRVS